MWRGRPVWEQQQLGELGAAVAHAAWRHMRRRALLQEDVTEAGVEARLKTEAKARVAPKGVLLLSSSTR